MKLRNGVSFYGNTGGGISPAEVDRKIEENNELIKTLIDNHIIISETQPTTQKTGDIWLQLKTAN